MCACDVEYSGKIGEMIVGFYKNRSKIAFFLLKNLHISKKSSTFAPAFESKNGPLAQLNRVPHYGCGGCRFESCMDHREVIMRLRGFFHTHFFYV